METRLKGHFRKDTRQWLIAARDGERSPVRQMETNTTMSQLIGIGTGGLGQNVNGRYNPRIQKVASPEHLDGSENQELWKTVRGLKEAALVGCLAGSVRTAHDS